MTEQQFKIEATENVKQIINYISKNEYENLLNITSIHESWCDEGEGQADGLANFVEWLEGQLELWKEDYEKEFVIDAFEEEQLDIMHFEGQRGFANYEPQSFGEPLEFWFEIEFMMDENDKLTSQFHVNV